MGLGPTEGAVLGALLKVAKSLRRLVLSYNNIRDEGAAAIGASLRSPGALEMLSLELCGFGAAGATAIADGLRRGSSSRLKTCLLYTSPSPRD